MGTFPSTVKTAQREIWSTKVHPEQHRPLTGLPALHRPLRQSHGGPKNVALSIPQGSFLFPFLGSNSILHSDWPTITSLFPLLLENHICPPRTLLSQFLLLPNDREDFPGCVFLASSSQLPIVLDLVSRGSAGSVLTSLAMQIYAALRSVLPCFPATLESTVSLLSTLLSADLTPNCLRPSLPPWWGMLGVDRAGRGDRQA